MSMPSIPEDIDITRKIAINTVIVSIAMEELSLAHILNAEGEKLQYVLGTLGTRDPGEITVCDVMEVNKSIRKTLRDVIKAEMLLDLKLEEAADLIKDEDEDEEQL